MYFVQAGMVKSKGREGVGSKQQQKPTYWLYKHYVIKDEFLNPHISCIIKFLTSDIGLDISFK